MHHEFLVMLLAQLRRLARFLQSLEFQKTGDFSHDVPSVSLSAGRAAPACPPLSIYAAIFSLACFAACNSPRARLYSVGNTLTNLPRAVAQSSSRLRARGK